MFVVHDMLSLGIPLSTLPVLFLIILALPASADTYAWQVTSIVDGDTLKMASGENEIPVRLHNIDAPEKGQPFGDRARSLLNVLCSKRTVLVRPQGRDGFKRLLAEVILPPTRSVNLELVSQGLAWTIRPTEDSPLFLAQAKACELHKGLWSDRQPIPPWDWRLGRFPGGYVRPGPTPTRTPKNNPSFFPGLQDSRRYDEFPTSSLFPSFDDLPSYPDYDLDTSPLYEDTSSYIFYYESVTITRQTFWITY